ncbi:MAG: hypothetical protein AABZ12_02930 [Planctomycetota bacterium]
MTQNSPAGVPPALLERYPSSLSAAVDVDLRPAGCPSAMPEECTLRFGEQPATGFQAADCSR